MRGLPKFPPPNGNNYSAHEIQQAKEAPTFPPEYECMGLPYDKLSPEAKQNMLVALSELKEHRNTLYKKPIEEQASFADAVCRTKTADAEWIDEQISEASMAQFKAKCYNISECIIGNLAYVSLYAPREKQRNRARHALDEYVMWRGNRPDWYIRIMSTKEGSVLGNVSLIELLGIVVVGTIIATLGNSLL